MVYQVGKEIIIKEDIVSQCALSGEKVILKKGEKAIVGGDNVEIKSEKAILHFENGKMAYIDVPVKGLSKDGLSSYLAKYLINNISSLEEALSSFDIDINDIKYTIEEGLEDLDL